MIYSADTALTKKINNLITILEQNSKKVNLVVRNNVTGLLESIYDEVILLENYNKFLEEENAKLKYGVGEED